MARHYGTAIVPARPYKARDKAKVEVGVQIAQRWILARLRNQTFFSLGELNRRIAELLEDLNSRPMKKLGGVTRRELFERYDRPALRSLPSEAYEIAEWDEATVNLDYHVEHEKHWYSAPYLIAQESVWVRATATTIELFHRGDRVASHARSREQYRHTTDPAHRPEAHRRHSAGVDGVLAWGASVGPMTEAMVRRLIEANPVREQGWRSARGLQRVGEKHGAERTELACERALRLGARSYKIVANMLKLGREREALPGDEPDVSPGRGLDKAMARQLGQCVWVAEHLSVLLVGPTGVGKSYVACALGQAACRRGLRVLYRRVPRLLDELALARAEGSVARLLARLAKADVLVLLADAILDRLVNNAYKIDLKGHSRRKVKTTNGN